MNLALKYKIISLLALIVLGFSCTKVSEEPVFDTTPQIELIGISSDTIVQFVEAIDIRIKYKDGDGDLGNSNPDIDGIFIKDQRLEKEDSYYLAPLAPETAKVSIEGILNIEIAPPFLLGNGTKELTNFEIYLIDRAGNKSNVIQTGVITILKE